MALWGGGGGLVTGVDCFCLFWPDWIRLLQSRKKRVHSVVPKRLGTRPDPNRLLCSLHCMRTASQHPA